MKNINCLLCGVGGQGTVLASKLIAYAAMEKGMDVRTAETIGMAQRGGSVVSHVRIGKDICSPVIPKNSADIIIAFEPAEAARCISYLKKGGTVIVNKKAVMPVTAAINSSYKDGEEMTAFLKGTGAEVKIIDGEEICGKCGSDKVLNIVLLAAAANSGALGITADELKNAVSNLVKPKFHELNFKAIDTVKEQENL